MNLSINLNDIWKYFFGTTQWLGIDIGFWAAMLVCAVVVILMNIVFWGMKPKRRAVEGGKSRRE